ncbi:hypothetical protein OD91_2108 [Lutibacter sp. Hel_I_33_5]|uniref:hypothetical protein n=1 Tax=Lutibacter sp. Hel_I_33_5 TaxID=1566289 RepID=UPI00119DF566|nr:hypothetical protein [Lutibacter sp. Hel_I_33_5]TVZ56808.1 hypothetical protein OD91_2108 [Lutibacter sp. Hel_I_33_5]
MNIKKTLFFQIFKTLGLLELFIAAGLFLDSKYFIPQYANGQNIATIILTSVLVYLYWKATKRTREQIIYAVLIAIIGEYLFCLGFGMYTYRLENVPHYVPPGHAIMYLGVFYFVRQPKVIINRKNLELALYSINGLFATYFLLFKNDVLGFSLTVIIFYIVYKKPRERLFYLGMYLAIAILELIGTSYGCWWWPTTWFGKVSFIPSGNPPSGISFFYFGLDLGCLYFYKLRHKVAWSRMKNIRKIRQEKELITS